MFGRKLLIGTAVTALAGAGARYYGQGAECKETADLRGKVVLVTGGNTGIGKETAIGLAKMGAKVIIGCRDLERSAPALAEIKRISNNDAVELMPLDLADLQSVRAFAQSFSATHEPIDILVANAGLGVIHQRKETKDGFELCLGTNHLGHFLLVNLLLENMKRKAQQKSVDDPLRVVVVSSMAQRAGKIHFDDLQLQKKYDMGESYTQSKLANVMFARELQKRLNNEGFAGKIITSSVHPGAVASEFGRYAEGATATFMNAFYYLLGKTPQRGAQPSIYAAISKDVAASGGGKYYNDWLQEATMNPIAKDDAACQRLWAVSESLTTPTAAATATTTATK